MKTQVQFLQRHFKLYEQQQPHGTGTSATKKRYDFTDDKVVCGNSYRYKIQSVSTDGTIKDYDAISVIADVPKTYSLYQNYPNPFNPSTMIQFDLKQTSTVTLDIYNIIGQRMFGESYGLMNAGRYDKNINFASYAGGVYFYRITAEGSSGEKFVAIKKAVFMK